MLYAILKGMSTFVSWLPYKFVVRLGRNCGKLYYHIAKSNASVPEKDHHGANGHGGKRPKETIYRLFLNLGMILWKCSTCLPSIRTTSAAL